MQKFKNNINNKGKLFHFLLIIVFICFAWYDKQTTNINLEFKTTVNKEKHFVNNNIASTTSILAKSRSKNNTQEIKNNNIDFQKYYPVKRVVDGDTFVATIGLQDEKIRLIGINTPETVDPRKTVECFGKEASERAKELLSGKKVALKKDETQGNRDKYGRLLRYVWLENGLFVNLAMIKGGYAYEYTYRLPYLYQQQFREAEKYARENGLGLWGKEGCGQENNL